MKPGAYIGGRKIQVVYMIENYDGTEWDTPERLTERELVPGGNGRQIDAWEARLLAIPFVISAKAPGWPGRGHDLLTLEYPSFEEAEKDESRIQSRVQLALGYKVRVRPGDGLQMRPCEDCENGILEYDQCPYCEGAGEFEVPGG